MNEVFAEPAFGDMAARGVVNLETGDRLPLGNSQADRIDGRIAPARHHVEHIHHVGGHCGPGKSGPSDVIKDAIGGLGQARPHIQQHHVALADG